MYEYINSMTIKIIPQDAIKKFNLVMNYHNEAFQGAKRKRMEERKSRGKAFP